MRLRSLEINAVDSYRWSRSRLGPTGAWSGHSPKDLSAYYKAPWAFSASGDQDAALASLEHICNSYLHADGDLGPTDNAVLRERHPLYPHAHIAIGALCAGRTDVTDAILDFLNTQRDARWTAWGDRHESDRRLRYDSISSAIVGLAFLERGHLDMARGVVDFLGWLLANQPNPEVEYFSSVTADGKLITSFNNAEAARDRVIRFTKRFQVWWAMSLPLIFLARFVEMTGEPAAQRSADRFLGMLDRSPQAWSDMSVGKAALGCALLYRHHGAAKYRSRAMKAVRSVISCLAADGGWSTRQGATAGQPSSIRYEVNLEFALMLSLVGNCIAERDESHFLQPAQAGPTGGLEHRICLSKRALLRELRRRTYQLHAMRTGRWLKTLLPA